MSEEERIISSIKPIVNARKTHKDNNLYSLQLTAYQLDMIQGLLDLYNKEKATSHYIQSQLDIANAKLIELENADLTTVYMNGFYDGEKKWKEHTNKLIRYIAVKENKDYEKVKEEFEIGG